VESLRIDHANTILGLRVNVWTSLVTLGVVALFFARDRMPVVDPSVPCTSQPAGSRVVAPKRRRPWASRPPSDASDEEQ
ncbi:MAG: hypothetical protein QOI86_1830, partial [Actinomycetota bacterium]|nr:hypothetical protein [Actinomycetota bacterium]